MSFRLALLAGAFFLAVLARGESLREVSVVKGGQGVEYGGTCYAFRPCIAVRLDAPGQILSVKYFCEGRGCRAIHPCPDAGRCGGAHPYDVEIAGDVATWYAWTKSSAPAVLKFRILYEPDPNYGAKR